MDTLAQVQKKQYFSFLNVEHLKSVATNAYRITAIIRSIHDFVDLFIIDFYVYIMWADFPLEIRNEMLQKLMHLGKTLWVKILAYLLVQESFDFFHLRQ